MAAAADANDGDGDASVSAAGEGLFSGVWHRLRSVATVWRRRGASGDEDDEEEEEEVSVRSRLERRAAAACRVGRKLVVVSLNLEVLVFVYAFWRARRRNVSWRRSVQALPMLIIPAFATIIYAAFVRFTRMLDLNDRKMLERSQVKKQLNGSEPKDSYQTERKSTEKYRNVDVAENSVSATDSVEEMANLRKNNQSSIHLRDDCEEDLLWGHSKDFQPVHTEGLRHRRLLNGRTNVIGNSTFLRPINKSFEHLANDPDYIVPNQIGDHSRNLGTEFGEHEVAYASTNKETNLSLPGCSMANMNLNAMSCAECSSLMSCSKTLAELPEGYAEQEAYTVPAKMKGQEMDFISDKEAVLSSFDGKSVHNDPNNLLYVASDPEVCPLTLSVMLAAGGDNGKAPYEEKCSFVAGDEISVSPLGCDDAYVMQNNLNFVSSDLVTNHPSAFEELPTVSCEEELLKVSTNDVEGSSSDKEIPTSPGVGNEDDSQSKNTSPISSGSAPSKMYLKVDRNEQASAVPPQSDLQEDTSISTEDTATSPLDCNHHSRPTISSMVAEVSVVHQELPAGGGKEETLDVLLENENTRSSSSKETPTYPVDCDDTNDVCCTEPILSLWLSTTLEERLINASEENSSTLSLPEKLEFSPTFSKEASKYPLGHSVAHSSSNDLSPNEPSPVLSVAETFKKLPAEGGKEEALVVPQQPILLQTDSFISEEIPTSCASINNDVTTISDEETSPLAPICNNADNNAIIVSLIAVGPEINFSACPELLGEEGEEKESSNLQPEENGAHFNLEKALVCSLEVNTTGNCLDTSGISLSGQEAELMEVHVDFSLTAVSPELNFLAFPELLADGGEDTKKKESSELQIAKENGIPFNLENETLLGPRVTNTVEYCSGTSGLCSQEISEIMEAPGSVNEGLSVSQDERSFNYQKDAVTSLYGVSNAKILTDASDSAQFIPEANIREALQGGQEELSMPLLENTFSSEGLFLSPNGIDNNEIYSSNSTSYFFSVGTTEVPLAGQEGPSESHDGMALSSVEASISPDMVNSAENCTNNPRSSECAPECGKTEFLGNNKQASSKSLQNAIFSFEESFLSPDEGINYEKYSLYSRSSSCVSEVNIMEALGGGTSSELEDKNDFNFEERTSMIFPSVNSSAKNYSNDSESAEFIPATNIMGTLQGDREALADSPLEVSFNFENNFISLDEDNDVENYSDLSSSSHPEDDVYVASHAGQEGSSEQYGNDFAFKETPTSPREINNAENCLSNSAPAKYFLDLSNTVESLQYSEILSFEALQVDQEGFSEPQHENDCTFQETLMSSEEISDAENNLKNSDPAESATDLCNTVENLQDDKEAPSKYVRRYTFGFEEPSVSPDVGSKAENHSGKPWPSLCFMEVNLTESLGDNQEGTFENQDETIFSFEDTSMAYQEASAANHFNNSGSQDIAESNTVETHQGGEEASFKTPNDNTYCGDSNTPDDGNNSGTVSFIAEVNMTAALLCDQEGSFESPDEHAFTCDKTSIYPAEVDNVETSNSKPVCFITEVTMEEALQDVRRAPAVSQHDNSLGFVDTSISSDEGHNAQNYSDHLRSLVCKPEDILMEALAAGQQGSFEPQRENFSCFEKTSTSIEVVRSTENLSTTPMSLSYNSTKEAIGSAEKGLSEPLPKDIHSFKEAPIDQDEVNMFINENTHSSEETAIAQDEEDSSNNSRSSSCTPKANSSGALEGGHKGLFNSQHQEELETTLSPGMTYTFRDKGEDAENNCSNSSSVSCYNDMSIVQSPQGLPEDAGSKKVLLEDKKGHEWLSTDEEAKNELEDIADDAEDLDESNHIDPLEVAQVTPVPSTKPSLKLYAKDTSWRDSAMGTSNDFEVARVAGLRLRKPVFTSNSTGSSTISEPADELSAEPVNADAETLNAPLPSLGARNIQNS